MPSRHVVITGIMTWEEPASNPPGIWGGGNVPMPTPPIPIYPGGTPNPPGIWGGGNVPMPSPPIANVPGAPGYNPNPPGIWGPPGPWPSPPIHLPPGWASGNPPGIWGGGNQPFPTPPIAGLPGLPGYFPPLILPNPPNTGGGPAQPIAPIETPGGIFVVYWSPVFGWVLVPAAGPGGVPTPPEEVPPVPEG